MEILFRYMLNFGSNIDKPKRWVKNVTLWLGSSIFDPKLVCNNPAFFRVWFYRFNQIPTDKKKKKSKSDGHC